MIKPLMVVAAAITAVSFSSPASAGRCDGLRGQSRATCQQAEAEAARYARQARNYERLARVRDALCVADAAAPMVASRSAGSVAGGLVYRGSRAVGNAVTRGASSCTPRAQ